MKFVVQERRSNKMKEKARFITKKNPEDADGLVDRELLKQQ